MPSGKVLADVGAIICGPPALLKPLPPYAANYVACAPQCAADAA